ncbi:hypothetical protein HY636_02300 [Candidatus Woesearchaeota archaeon]|nr:hypothetical protein [Candidatus Woesearchaeota archaeon]
MSTKYILTNIEPELNATSDELADVLIQRLGLMPRKKGSTEKMHRVLIELYEKSKTATREKDPKKAIMAVEEMALHAGITRQTMYEYLRRWLELDLISKTSYIDPWNKVIIGYKLNGSTIEQAFERARRKVHLHLDETQKYVVELQKLLKNEKISDKISEKAAEKAMEKAAEMNQREDENTNENTHENTNREDLSAEHKQDV